MVEIRCPKEASVTVERLYKYGSLNEHSEVLFSTPQVWFSAPSQLNDPFECRPWLTFECNKDEFVGKFSKLLKDKRFLTKEESTEKAIEIYLQGRHHDPYVCEEFRWDIAQMLENKIGLYCLSRIPDSILMWSHYGHEHEGYCLEFEATDHTVMFGEAQPVLYSDSYPIVEYFKTPKEKQIDLVFLTKYKSWAYEQEWRIINFRDGLGLCQYPAELLKSVTFGLRMPDAQKTLIREWVRQRGHFVQFFEAVQGTRTFSIELQNVT